MEYLWVVNGVQENFLDNENVDLSCIEITDNQTYANRLWKPEDCAPDMYEDYDPNDPDMIPPKSDSNKKPKPPPPSGSNWEIDNNIKESR